jgi:hypothetical protein
VADLVVIPSARLVASELQAEFGPIPPALIPLDGRPAMRFILDGAVDGSSAIIGGHEGVEMLRERAARVPLLDVVDVGPTTSLAETVLEVLRHRMPHPAARLVVNFADTLVPSLPREGDAIAFRVEQDTYRWTAFRHDERGGIGHITEKSLDKGDEPLPVFVGVFAFADARLFVRLLREAVDDAGGPVDPFFVAVRRYVRSRGPQALHAAHVWHDIGHVDTYYMARQRLFIDRRAFNDVEVDARRGVIRKRSTEAAKLRREVAWYKALPPSCAVLAPRVLDEGGTDDEAFVDLEFYGYPPLADAYLYGAWDIGAWNVALECVEDAARQLHVQDPGLDEATTVAALRAMYEDKTEQRLAAILADPHFAWVRGERLEINGRPCLGLDGALRALPAIAAALGLCAQRPLGVIHGDLCLSNLLYDRRNGIVRLVDPRGAFGELRLHGDPLYDHAKLAHSIEGDYDHLLRGLFTLDLAPGRARLDVQLTAAQRAVKALHDRRADRLLGGRRDLVTLIESLLFLTMVPLHGDRPESQRAFLVRGLELLSGVAATVGVLDGRQAVAAA